MDKKSEDSNAILRREAEAKLKDWNLPDDVPAEDAKRLIQELRVHQIELEMQNEELRKTQAQLEESSSQYADLYDFAPVGYVTLDEQGLIWEANLTAASQLGTERARLARVFFLLTFASRIRKNLVYTSRGSSRQGSGRPVK